VTRIGCTGHQTLTVATRRVVSATIASILSRASDELVGVCSLAVGADQLFAHLVLAAGGKLHVVIPSAGYDKTFEHGPDLATYHALLSLAHQQRALSFSSPSEDAYLAAGHTVVDSSDSLIAVWDGQEAAGLGGTADVVGYARQQGTRIEVVWPSGSRRS
jgi:hypothetical protein